MTTEVQFRASLRPLAGPDESEHALARLAERLTDYPPRSRTLAHIRREYDKEKYGALLASAPEHMEQALELQNSTSPEGEDLVVYRNELCLGTQRQIQALLWQRIDRTLKQRFAAAQANWICELGCGFGGHLARCGLPSYGGELTPNGVRLAQSLGQDVSEFDFYDPQSYRFLRPRSVIFTCHAIEQFPSATAFLENLRAFRHHVAAVVHFEPLARRGTSTLGQMQEQYLEVNDYNRDLYELLSAASDVELLQSEFGVAGSNPLNPASLLEWRFRDC